MGLALIIIVSIGFMYAILTAAFKHKVDRR